MFTFLVISIFLEVAILTIDSGQLLFHLSGVALGEHWNIGRKPPYCLGIPIVSCGLPLSQMSAEWKSGVGI